MGRIRRKSRPKFFGKKLPFRAIRKANRRRKRSSLELEVYGWLDGDGIPYKKEYPIGRCHVDLLFAPRTVVELNGCHWHGCRICNRELSAAQRMAQEKDARRYAFLRSKGFDVVVIWECEVNHEPERVRAVLHTLAQGSE